jgi:type II secretory pathway component PulF
LLLFGPVSWFIAAVKLSLSQKETFYRELEQFVRSGIPLPHAVEALAPETRGPVRRVLEQLLAFFLKGQSVGDAFGALRPTFGALETLRAGVVRRTIWPVVQLHFGVLIANAGGFVLGQLTLEGYLLHCGLTLAAFYAGGLVAWLLIAALLRLARTDARLDHALGLVPMLGKLRRHLALSRFCATYEMQLQAGINVMDSVRAAADSSQSARIESTVARLLPRMVGGASLGTLITGEAAFPAALQRSIRLGEENGSLDEDLVRWSGYYQKSAVDALETLGAWISRLVYIVVALYFIYSIFVAELGQVHTLDQLMK